MMSRTSGWAPSEVKGQSWEEGGEQAIHSQIHTITP